MRCPSSSSRISWRRCRIPPPLLLGLRASLYWSYQTRAHSHWETVGSDAGGQIFLDLMTPHRPRCEWLFFPAGCSMKEITMYLVSFWLWTTISGSCWLSGRPFLGPPPRASKTLGIAPSLLLTKNFAVPQILKVGTWQKHTTFRLNYMRVLVHRSLKTFQLGPVVPAHVLV